jgi:hypothetical protein
MTEGFLQDIAAAGAATGMDGAGSHLHYKP